MSNFYIDLSKLSSTEIKEVLTYIKETLGGKISYITENFMIGGTFACRNLVYERKSKLKDYPPRWTAYGDWYPMEEHTVELTLEEFLKTAKEQWKIID